MSLYSYRALARHLVAVASFSAFAGASYAASTPNVLLIAVDDLRPELGCYGATAVKSPNLDKLASEGRVFDRAYCQYAICGPSRASLLTGLRPNTLKIKDIDTFFRNTVPDCVTLPQYFRRSGYQTMYIGKVFHPRQEDDKNSWDRRIRLPGKGGEQSSFGRVQTGISAAYLGMAEEAYGRLKVMAVKRSMNPSLITSHEPHGAIFNTDGNGGIPQIVNTMLVFSRPGRLDLLPALPKAWSKGEIRGILARPQITINRLAWNRRAGTVRLTLTSGTEQSVSLRLGEKRQELALAKNKPTEVLLPWHDSLSSYLH